MSVVLPIYYTQEFKTKNDKTFLVGMNWYNTAHYHIKNKVKQDFTELILKQLTGIEPIQDKFKVHYKLYYKNISSDPSNIVALAEKIFLDAIQKGDIVKDDNMKYHTSSSWEVIGIDKDNPRVEISISAVS